MKEKIILLANYVLLYSFYGLFFLVPLTFTSSTYELFEFNKMWLVFVLTVFIAASWMVKMCLRGRLQMVKTPLDLPILLFLLSQIVSTIFSLDSHVSFWGYYSRFNGGLLSIIAYITLYYAFVNNRADVEHILEKKSAILTNTLLTFLIPSVIVMLGLPFAAITGYSSVFILFALLGFISVSFLVHGTFVKRLLHIALVSGFIVALWGLPSHFGYDPTCLLFRGTFDVSCWTDAFQPKIRIFSTFGQPNWLAAYLAILIPIVIGLILQSQISNVKSQISNNTRLISYFLSLISILFYVCLIYTGSQSGYLGLLVGLGFLISILGLPHLRKDSGRALLARMTKDAVLKSILAIVGIFALIAFIFGQPIHALDKFTLPSLQKHLFSQPVVPAQDDEKKPFAGELGGTDSGTIRKIVWTGALEVWKKNPLIGSGVETYAFAYYQHRPTAHNMTSEWDYLYNKAHNEYLNFLATTGAFGLGTYLLMIGSFLFISLKKITNHKSQITTKSHIENSNLKTYLGFGSWDLGFVTIGLLASYVTILVSNFFGFSVVVINIYFFLIPAFVLILLDKIDPKNIYELGIRNKESGKIYSFIKWAILTFIILTSLFMLQLLARYWIADTNFAKGYNLDRAGQYQLAYTDLRNAIMQRSTEPTFLDEYSYNTAVLAVALEQQGESTSAALLRQEAERISDLVVTDHPKNVVFWKTRVRTFYALSQVNEVYLRKALEAIQKAHELAPTDAKVSYNLGILYGQNGQIAEAIKQLEETVELKPDYVDARYGLGLYYRELATDDKGVVTDERYAKLATDTMQFIIDNFPKDQAVPAQEALEGWKKQ